MMETDRTGKRLPFALTRPELARLLQAPSPRSTTGTRTRAILACLSGAGLRVGELVALAPGDVRWDASRVEVRRGKGAKARNVPVSLETMALLKGWDLLRPSGSRCFFCTHKGGPLLPRYIQFLVKRTALKANIPNAERVTPHILRHSMASLSLSDGLNLREVQKLLGHSRVSTTEIYTHVNDDELAAKVQARPPIQAAPVVQRNVLVTNVARPEPADLNQRVERMEKELGETTALLRAILNHLAGDK